METLGRLVEMCSDNDAERNRFITLLFEQRHGLENNYQKENCAAKFIFKQVTFYLRRDLPLANLWSVF